MRIACTADWHIHEFQDFAKQILVKWDERRQRYVPSNLGKEMNSRLFHILDGICDMRDFCTTNKIYRILHAGDVFHKRGSITVNTFNAAHRILQTFGNCGLEMIIIAGNHDQVDSSIKPDTSIHTLAKSFGIMVAEEPGVHLLSQGNEQVSVVCIPYGRNKNHVLSSLQQLKTHIENARDAILLMHCGVTGGAVGSGMHLMTDDYSLDELYWDKWKYVVLGHYHRPQMLSHNTFYCGTPVQNTFNDELPDEENGGYNGFFVVDTSKQFDVEFVPIQQPRFITVDSVDKIKNYSSDNYFRVKTNVDDVSDVGDNVRVEVEKDYKVDTRSSIGLTDTFEEAARKYYQENYKGNYPEALDLGLSLLSEARRELS